jgi:diguanylate cyclase (GGDEF)-like protein
VQDADYRRLVEDSPLATILLERSGARGWTVTWVNHAAADLFGGRAPLPLDQLVHAEDLADVESVLDRGTTAERTAHEWRFAGPGERWVTVEVLLGAVGDALAMSCWDVSQHVARTRDLTHRATHDRLTGLPNRGLLEDRWDLARSRARRTGTAPVVAFCDVDDLKRLNDEHGHLVGDQALVAIADRLLGASRGGDTVARFGGDEFIVLVESSADVDPAALTRRLREAVSGVPLELPDGRRIAVSCSVGLVVDDLGEPTETVLARADRHIYEDKRRRRGESF